MYWLSCSDGCNSNFRISTATIFQGQISWEMLKQFWYVKYVVYMKGRKYINLVETGLVILEIQKAEFGNFAVPVNDTLVYYAFFYFLGCRHTWYCFFSYRLFFNILIMILFGCNLNQSLFLPVILNVIQLYLASIDSALLGNSLFIATGCCCLVYHAFLTRQQKAVRRNNIMH